jgi:hypothetical protein
LQNVGELKFYQQIPYTGRKTVSMPIKTLLFYRVPKRRYFFKTGTRDNMLSEFFHKITEVDPAFIPGPECHQ